MTSTSNDLRVQFTYIYTIFWVLMTNIHFVKYFSLVDIQIHL